MKRDVITIVLLATVLGLQTYAMFFRHGGSPQKVLDANDAAYQHAVFEDSDVQGIMQQVFRQNEVDRELLKAVLARCGG